MSLELLSANLLSPMVLAFVLGAIATLVRSDLKLPNGLYSSLSIYLLFAIGLKGGVALSKTNPGDLWLPGLGTVILGIATAGTAYFAAKVLGKLSRVDAAALAAHFGSVSAVTFIAATSFVQAQGMTPEGYLPALVAVLEIPAIILGLVIGNKGSESFNLKDILHELLTGRTVLLLVGGILIGLVSGQSGVQQVQPLFGDLFKGALTIFMLEMGLLAAQRFGDLRQHALFLGIFGTVIPVVNGLLGVLVGKAVGLTPAGCAVLGAMAASASYIAAPTAVRLALPKANPALYLTAALAVTFPFNLTIGIPLFLLVARSL